MLGDFNEYEEDIRKKILSMVLSQRRLEGEVKWDVKGIYPLFKGL